MVDGVPGCGVLKKREDICCGMLANQDREPRDFDEAIDVSSGSNIGITDSCPLGQLFRPAQQELCSKIFGLGGQEGDGEISFIS